MRQEPPLTSLPATGAAFDGAAGAVPMTADIDATKTGRFSQDHAPDRGMSMILAKVFFTVFAVAVGIIGLVFIILGDINGVMIGIPVALVGFVCAYSFVTKGINMAGNDRDFERPDAKFNKGDTWDTAYIATGEMRVIDQMTRGEGRFADIS